MEVNDSQRLTFELVTEKDTLLLHQLDQDPEVMRYLNGGKPSSMATIVDAFMPRVAAYTKPSKGWGLWKVTIKASNSFIGWILVRPMEFFSDHPEFDNLELGWRFMQSSWGKGYASEAAIAVRDALIKHGNISALSATAIDENTGSIAIMKKLGMTYLKTFPFQAPHGEVTAVYYQLRL
ncbi:GNAT family N-acetyltransferase [Thalassotalea sp. PLHSN55]|uniref:GNAT family N-acetyltransferase n=1 Tax=Thalassotalea sp. PLHSN55 TaxID=3435888 RepID=UPI003F847DEB